jgi:hypothetical protein
VLRTIADLSREHADELMKLQALDNSVPLSFGGEIYAMSPGFVADVFDHHVSWADKISQTRRCRRTGAATTWSSRCASRSAWWAR